MDHNPPPELLGVSAAAEVLGIHRTTLHRLHVAGAGPRSVRLLGSRRYRRSDLSAWLDERTQ